MPFDGCEYKWEHPYFVFMVFFLQEKSMLIFPIRVLFNFTFNAKVHAALYLFSLISISALCPYFDT